MHESQHLRSRYGDNENSSYAVLQVATAIRLRLRFDYRSTAGAIRTPFDSLLLLLFSFFYATGQLTQLTYLLISASVV